MFDAQHLRDRMRAVEIEVPTGRWSRLWRTGRTAAGMASTMLGDRRVDAADLAALIAQMGELRGVAMKAGQILSYIDPTIPEDLRSLLAVLQTQAAPSVMADVEATILEAFGDDGWTLLAAMEPVPTAVASIGQVHRAMLPDGDRVAVKVRHPGVADALRADFKNAGIGALFSRLLPGGGSVRGLIDEARTAMLDECDFAREAANQRAFHGWYAAHPTLVIPATVDRWCSGAVMTSQWLPGRSLDSFLAMSPSQAERDRVGVALFELFVGTLYRHGVFHADPHPGNLAILDDGRVVIYDFGCVRTFTPAVVAALAALLAAVRADDFAAIERALDGIGATAPTRASRRDHVRTLLRGFFAPLLETGPHAIDPGSALAAGELFADKRALLGLSLPGSLLFLLRLRFGLYAVLARIGAVADWAALEAAWAVRTSASA